MRGYTKLHAKIVHSSIWREPIHVKVVWITMLAMADQHGVVEGSVGGLAHAAGVTREQCIEALDVLLGPDPDSSDGTTGERIEQVPGGWFVINHANYRDKQTDQQAMTAERVRRYRERRRKSDDGASHETGVTLGNERKRSSAYGTLDSGDASASRKKKKASTDPKRPDDFDRFWDAYGKKVGRKNAVAQWNKIDLTDDLVERIISAASAYARTVKPEYHKYPEGWLADSRWEDEIDHLRTNSQPVNVLSSSGKVGDYGRPEDDPDWEPYTPEEQARLDAEGDAMMKKWEEEEAIRKAAKAAAKAGVRK